MQKRMFTWIAAVAFALVGCQRITGLDDLISMEANDAGKGGAGGHEAVVGSTSTATSNGATGTSSSGAGGMPPLFHAHCAGQVACPTPDPCADWDYEVTDDGQASLASVNLKLHIDASETCYEQSAGPTAPVVVPSDTVALQCGSSKWTLSIDRTTMTVYMTRDPMTGDPVLSWTPACSK